MNRSIMYRDRLVVRDLSLTFGRYKTSNTLAIGLYENGVGPFDHVSTNLHPILPGVNCIFVPFYDENRYKESFLLKQLSEWFEATGKTARSGFCEFHEVRLTDKFLTQFASEIAELEPIGIEFPAEVKVALAAGEVPQVEEEEC